MLTHALHFPVLAPLSKCAFLPFGEGPGAPAPRHGREVGLDYSFPFRYAERISYPKGISDLYSLLSIPLLFILLSFFSRETNTIFSDHQFPIPNNE